MARKAIPRALRHDPFDCPRNPKALRARSGFGWVSFDLRAGERAAGRPERHRQDDAAEDPGRTRRGGCGDVDWAAGTSVGFLEQHPQFVQDRTLWDEAREALRDLIDLAEQAEAIAHQLSQTDDPVQHQRLGQRFDHLQQELHRRDGYHLDHKIERVLTGLGFDRPSFQQPVSQLSGGQQNRLLLAKLLLEQPDRAVAGRAVEPLGPGGHPVAGRLPGGFATSADPGQSRPLFPGPGDDPHAGVVPRHGGFLPRQLLGVPAAESRTAWRSSGAPTSVSRKKSPRWRISSVATSTARSTPRPKTGGRSWSGSSRSSRRERSPRRRCGSLRPAGRAIS
jgi:hypothetical protein